MTTNHDDGIDVRTITDDEIEAYGQFFPRQFGGVTLDGEHDRLRTLLGTDRIHAAFDGDEMVGSAAGFRFALTVPGGELRAAGLTRVSVSATHRRRGILGRLMHAHFETAVSAGDAISVLWSSEAPIYGRYGYGVATENCRVGYDRRTATIPPPPAASGSESGPGPGSESVSEPIEEIRYADDAMARAHLPPLHETVRRATPGMFARTADWWDLRYFVDHDWMQEGGGPRRTVVSFRDGHAVGYAMFRLKRSWGDDELPNGTVVVEEVVAVDDRASHGLWAFLSGIDLFPKVQADVESPDLPIQWWCENHRAVTRSVNDGIWVRVLDVAAALGTRTYRHDDELVFDLTDDRRPDQAGRWELTVDGGVARCRRSTAEAAVDVTAAGLGSLLLGGIDPAWIRAGGHLTAGDDVLDRLRLLFRHPGRVHCGEVF